MRAIRDTKQTNPLPIVRSLQAIWHGFRLGQQKDAHEFLTIYLEAILNSSFSEKPSRAHVIKNQSQTPLFKIFGGKLRSQITCERCNYKSDTFDETFTLPVQLNAKAGDATLGQALKEFCSIDHLTKGNKYLCPKCNSKQNATKRTSINQAPRVLIFTIKRFDPFGRKIQAKIRYPLSFNVKAHMDEAVDGKKPIANVPDQVYDLYGVVVHQGGSTSSGHYYSYCKTDMLLD